MKSRITLRFEDGLIQDMDIFAHEQGRSRSNFIEHCIKMELKRRGRLSPAQDSHTRPDLKENQS